MDLERLKQSVENASTLTEEPRAWSEQARDYYDSHQLTAEEQATLRKRKQPIVISNRIKRKIDAMVGIEQRGRVDPRALPRGPEDEAAADIATKAMVFVDDCERIDVKRSSAFENLLIEGYGGVEVCAEMKRGKVEVSVKRVRWEEIFFDPYSREKDFSDAAYIGVQKWMAQDAAVAWVSQFYEGADAADLLDASASEAGQTYDDRPRESALAWSDKSKRRVRVAQMYYQDAGVWKMAIFSGKGEFYNGPSPYNDEYGQPTCPIKLMTAYIDRENRRYGLVRDMIWIQDEINKRRSKALHQANSRQTVGISGAMGSVAALKRELADPNGHVEITAEAFEDAARVGMKPFDVLPQADQMGAQFQLLQEAKSEIDGLGPNPALIGELGSSASGRAIQAQQQAGLAELAPIYDSLRDWTERVYRQVWAAIKQFWTDERWIRVTEEPQAPQFIGINQVQMGPMGPQMMNPVGEIDVDIIVAQSPDYATLRAEQFDRLVDLVTEKGIPIPPQLLIEASDLRDKEKLIASLQPPPEAQQQQAEAAQIGKAGAIADVEATRAKANRDNAEAQKTALEAGQLQAAQNAQAMQAMRFAAGY